MREARKKVLISARTDSQGSVPFAETLARCNAYVEAGCDALLAEGVTAPDQVAEIGRLFGARLPLIHNLPEGGASPFRSAAAAAPTGDSNTKRRNARLIRAM